MTSKIPKLTVDRIEEGVVIAFSDDGQKYTFAKEELPLKENDIFNAEIAEDGTVIVLNILKKETNRRKKSLRNRLKQLFNK